MSGTSGSFWRHLSLRRLAGSSLVLVLTATLGACSGGVSRFDYASFSNNSGDSQLTTSSLSPIPAESIYSGSASPYRSSIVRRDLPPPEPQQSMANAQQWQSQSAATPLQHQPYNAPQYQAPQYQPQAPRARYQAPEYKTPAPQAQYQPPQPARLEPSKNKTVSVQKGDTLYKLARRHDVSVDELKSANSLTTTRLSIGQELLIPGTVASAPAAYAGSYKVQRGDTLEGIAKKYGIPQSELQSANNISRPNRIRLGQELKIPGNATPVTVANKQRPVRVASRGRDIPLPSSKPASGKTAKTIEKKKRVVTNNKPLPKPKPMASNQFRWPVKGRIVSGFGKMASGKHNDGINVAVPAGTSIKAAENGVVAYAGSELEPYGNLILIRHSNNWVTAYAHSDKLLVKRGDTVRRGQIIAKAGKSGNVSQPQLHFELRKGSKPVNPLSYMASS